MRQRQNQEKVESPETSGDGWNWEAFSGAAALPAWDRLHHACDTYARAQGWRHIPYATLFIILLEDEAIRSALQDSGLDPNRLHGRAVQAARDEAVHPVIRQTHDDGMGIQETFTTHFAFRTSARSDDLLSFLYQGQVLQPIARLSADAKQKTYWGILNGILCDSESTATAFPIGAIIERIGFGPLVQSLRAAQGRAYGVGSLGSLSGAFGKASGSRTHVGFIVPPPTHDKN